MTIKGKTRDQFSSAKELVACGIHVRVASGVPLGPEYQAVGRSVPGFLNGILHSKAVLAGREAVIGSPIGLHVAGATSSSAYMLNSMLAMWT